ncbi:flagellar M-ring protein FliF [Rhodoferax sp. AJA081-3]|uniref:flagellar basal-body MS-ring/collar protein FliF n=1 Tax=Rhodoferax sp. AJA081-3 TaxID=2752316 RepID=UPI001ADFEDA2|nr:flagellar basal-body MS-ring/collar protein FliF [Rhodoferax sp. AJA081-3]QTN30241.1 flagellar M-ring protein FliF [Rhodoferax sp. AJA081-3]
MSAVATLPVNPTLAQRLAGLEQGQRLRLAIGIVLFVAIGIVGLVMGRQAEWRVLYSNLADKDGGAVVAQLSTLNVPYKHSEGGGAILVPADRVHDVRLKLAALGLPKGSVNGFEMMESNRFGMTQFQERLTFQRGLEGELTRSIQALSSVQNARVHLALPNQNGFFREQQKPSASVLLSLHPGRNLDRAQLAGIVHLVASSVPEMSPTAVSVLDDSGKLLSTPSDGSGGVLGVDAEQLKYVRQVEQQYSQRILDILEPIVGRANVKAQVTAELDFSQTESTTESHKPNQTADSSAIRSQQLVESTNAAGNTPPSGVPGATTNQPPGAAAAPINGAAQTLAAGAAGGQGALAGGGKRESIINYEVDKTIRVVKGASGLVKRINAAVVVNNNVTTNDKGKVVSTPLTDAQIEKMTALVRETVGFNKDRGDSVNLLNAAFVDEKVAVLDVPFYRQPEVVDLARSFAWPLGTLAFGALVLMGVIRPAIKAMGTAPVAGGVVGSDMQMNQLDAMESDMPERPQLTGPGTANDAAQVSAGEKQLEDARQLTRDNPAAVANIIKAWMNGEAPA